MTTTIRWTRRTVLEPQEHMDILMRLDNGGYEIGYMTSGVYLAAFQFEEVTDVVAWCALDDIVRYLNDQETR